jgi:hypothetical protein
MRIKTQNSEIANRAASIKGNDPTRLKSRPYSQPTLKKGPILTSIAATAPVPVTGNNNNVCWIAQAAFGRDDIRWMIFRAWLIEDAPAWFRQLYISYGESVGAWLTNRPRARAVVRSLMLPVVRKKVER